MTAAAKAYDELMKLPYSLIQITGSTQDQIKEQYRQIFLTKNSQESIWEVQHSNDGDFSNGFGHKLDRESVSPYYGGTVAAYSPTQNHVDEYGMRDGKAYDAYINCSVYRVRLNIRLQFFRVKVSHLLDFT